MSQPDLGQARTVAQDASELVEEPEPSCEEPSRRDIELRLASAKLIGSFVMKDRGSFNIEKTSTYGAAILIPQLARTSGWAKFLVALTVRSFAFHILNLAVQAWLLLMISKKERVMDLFAGQMYLCDFGAFLDRCPGSEGCTGPGGTDESAPRLYNWKQWTTRMFVRDSFLSLFPDLIPEIGEKVDPGEFGVESYGCRWLCCFIYMLTVMNELFLIFRMVQLLYYCPNRSDEGWLELDENHDPTQDWRDVVNVRIAGMPLPWKIFNTLFVFMPKVLLWKITAESGVTLLMETSGIENLIVNSVALSFVLSIDEMIFETMVSDAVKFMLEICEDFRLCDESVDDRLTREEIIEKYGTQQSLRHLRFCDIPSLFPPKLIVVLIVTAIYVFDYYEHHCEISEDGRLVSRDMYLPKRIGFTIGNAFFSQLFPVESSDMPYWTMPPDAPGVDT